MNPSTVRRRVQIREENEDERLDDAAATTEGEHDDERHGRTVRRRTRKELEQIHFQMVNDRVVEDITLDALYKPHTLTLLAVLCAFLFYQAFRTTDSGSEQNIYDGCMAVLVLFFVVSALAFPNGPFIRPHPILWRIIFGASVAYMLLLQFTLFQTYADIKKTLTWLDPAGLSAETLVEKEYAINCTDVSLERIWSHMDIFAVGHFLGWAMKALLIRHGIICWYISIVWEITEVIFTNLLPNFAECWWDAIVLDVLLCNGIGIWFGLKICRFLEMRQFHWESIKDISTSRAKFKRAVLQFTPENWARMEWFNSTALKRTMAVSLFILIWLLTELNTFFLKHVFAVDTKHPVVFWRIILIALISAPSIRQFYLYATDPLVKRIGMQCWVYCAVTALEAAVCIKNGHQMFPDFSFQTVFLWIALVIFGTFVSVWLSVWWAHTSYSETKEISVDGQKRRTYLDSSAENLGAIHDDVRRRRRSLGFSESDLH